MLTYLQLLIAHSFILLYQVDHQIVALNISKQLLQWIGILPGKLSVRVEVVKT